MFKRQTLLGLLALLPSFNLAVGQTTPPVIRLWNGAAPLSTGTGDKDTPSITEYLPANASPGTPVAAVIICPGGGYAGESMVYEGSKVAEWFQQRNVAGFVLKYRNASGGYRHPAPLLDAQRAIRLVRSRADQWNIDPHKIGIMGFSAGGHLAATAETHFDDGDPHSTDPVKNASCRPDFAILGYAVISMKDGITHVGSRNNLLGEHPTADEIADLSDEMHVTAQTPPTYIFYAANDGLVPPENSKVMYQALRAAGVPCQIQEYPMGGHGFGLGQVPDPGPPGWIEKVGTWLKSQNIMQ